MRSVNGFALLEVLAAVAILGIIALSFTHLFTGNLLLNKTTSEATKALYYAQEKIEEFKSMSFEKVRALVEESPLVEDTIKGDVVYSRISEIEQMEDELLKITVRVTWDDKEIKLVTLRAKR